MTRNEYRRNLDAVIKRTLIEDLEALNDEDFNETIKALKSGNKEAFDACLESYNTIYFKELNFVVNF